MPKILVIDIDGTMTDGGLYLGNDGLEIKKFNVRDGMGIVLARQAGLESMFLTGRKSFCVEQRANELGVIQVHQNVLDKGAFLKEYMAAHHFEAADIAYIGDDVNDMEAMLLAGIKGCPKDAAQEIITISNYVSTKNGGEGCVRDFIQWILAKKQR